MKDYYDSQLNELIAAGKEATRELNSLKLKKETPRRKELLVIRRSRLELIRQRATQLNLTQFDLDTIFEYIQMKGE